MQKLISSSNEIMIDDDTDTSTQGDQGKEKVETRGRGGAEVEVISRKRKRSPSLSPPPAPPPLPGSRPPFPCPPQRRPSIGASLVQTKEPCIWYRGEIKNLPRDEAREYALEMDQVPLRTPEVHRYVFWTDCSIVSRCGAGSVVWRDPENLAWQSEEHPYPRPTDSSTLVELFAIANALEIAVRQIKQDKRAAFDAFCQGSTDCAVQPRYHVLVFSDSIGALNRLKTGTSRQRKQDEESWKLVLKCIEHHAELERLQASVVAHLVPGHKEVPGNVEADQRAYTFARRMSGKEIPIAGLQFKESTTLEGTSSSVPRKLEDTKTGIDPGNQHILKTLTRKVRRKAQKSIKTAVAVSVKVAESTQGATTPRPAAERLLDTLTTLRRTIRSETEDPVECPKPTTQSAPATSKKQISQASSVTMVPAAVASTTAATLSIAGLSLVQMSLAQPSCGQPPFGQPSPAASIAATPSLGVLPDTAPRGATSSASTPEQGPPRPGPIHKLPARPRLLVYPSAAPPSVPDFGFRYP